MSLLEYDGTETPVLPEEVSRYNQAQQSRSVCVCVSVGFSSVVCTKEKGNLSFQESEAPVVSHRGGGQGCEFFLRGV